MLDDLGQTLAGVSTESGTTLLALTEQSPMLLIFLRHFGCSFCRQAISDVAGMSAELARRNVRPVFVHLGTPERAKPYFDYYHLEGVERVSDPGATLYQTPPFSLSRQHWIAHFLSPRWPWLGLWEPQKNTASAGSRKTPTRCPVSFF